MFISLILYHCMEEAVYVKSKFMCTIILISKVQKIGFTIVPHRSSRYPKEALVNVTK